MKLKIESRPFPYQEGIGPTYATACCWPRERYLTKDGGALGRIASTGTSHSQHEKDMEEVTAYMIRHPDCKISDIAMECNMSRHAVRRLLREI